MNSKAWIDAFCRDAIRDPIRDAFRKATGSKPKRQARARRGWAPELAPRVQPLPDEDDDGFNGAWFESSRSLARGLLVIEHPEKPAARAAAA